MNVRLIDGPIKTTDGMLAFVRDKVALGLAPFARNLRQVDVHIRDVNGPKGGVDKHCTIHAEQIGAESIVVRSHAADFYQAISDASRKLRRVLARSRKRREVSQRRT